MKPIVKEFFDDTAIEEEVEVQLNKGISPDQLYIISHDNDRTNRVAGQVDANTIGVKEEGIGTAIANIFRKKGDELRAKFTELGFTEEEASLLEEELDHGKILLIIKP